MVYIGLKEVSCHLNHFHIQVQATFSTLVTFETLIPPLQETECLDGSQQKLRVVNWYQQKGCWRWGLIKVEELLFSGVLQHPIPQGGVNAQLAVTGVSVVHRSYDATEHSGGEGITGNSVCRMQHVMVMVCAFLTEKMQCRQASTGLFIVAAKPLISDSAQPRHARFLIFLSFDWSHICFSLSNFLFSAEQLWLCEEDWYEMSKRLMGFATWIPPDHKQTIHICQGYLIPKQVYVLFKYPL